jgi:hypothetical protein
MAAPQEFVDDVTKLISEHDEAMTLDRVVAY